jgi:2-oxoglutarate dehydrogenase complex dehydrogenase (E1) component-like enzyme
MYRTIASHPTVRESWSRTLLAKGIIPPEVPDALVKKYFTELETTYASLKPEQEYAPPPSPKPAAGTAAQIVTGVPVDRLRELNDAPAHAS